MWRMLPSKKNMICTCLSQKKVEDLNADRIPCMKFKSSKNYIIAVKMRCVVAILVNVSSMHENVQWAIFVKQPVNSPSLLVVVTS